jgi:heterodisulfide reductase subunit C
MFLVAIGQSKMVKRPVAGILHIFVYVGFIIVNIEMLEILIDGVAGTHRALSFVGGGIYNFFASTFEIFALAVITACITFLVRRNILKVKRFQSREMTSWPRLDANIILFTEVLLMSAFLSMNAADTVLMQRAGGSDMLGPFVVSQVLLPWFSGFSEGTLHFIEQFGWWFHIIGVLAFLNYIPYSKHFHVFLAFPNTWYSKLEPKAKMSNMPEVTKEVQIMLGTLQDDGSSGEDMPSFGAKDVPQLSWKNVMDAFTCTECGRCTAVCPANTTGKLLSPRGIMMAVRDRAEEIGKNIDKNGKDYSDGKALLGNYITPEEIWACTTCNACVEECPVNINQVDIILALRRYMVMEQSAGPASINAMLTNIENNGAPWQYSAADRGNWADDVYMNKI